MALHNAHLKERASPQTSMHWSHDTQQTRLPAPHTLRANATVPQPSKSQISATKSSLLSRNQLNPSSSTSAGRQSAGININVSTTTKPKQRPSGLPRSSTSHSASRLDVIGTSRPAWTSAPEHQPRPDPNRSVGLVYNKDRSRNVLRRKALLMDGYTENHSNSSQAAGGSKPSHKGSTSLRGGHRDTAPDSIFGIAFPESRNVSVPQDDMPTTHSRRREAGLPSPLIPELQALATSSNMNGPGVEDRAGGMVSSPSTQCSDSPEPWSSRGTTPTSMASYSPGIVHPFKLHIGKRSVNAATALPSSDPLRNDARKMPILQEAPDSLPPASSTRQRPVTPEKVVEKKNKRRQPMTPAQTPPLTPPPRKSSIKFRSPRKHDGQEPHHYFDYVHLPRQVGKEHPLDSPLARKAERELDHIGQSLHRDQVTDRFTSNNLLPQRAPSRPSRKGIAGPDLRIFPTVQSNLSHLSARGRRLSESAQAPSSTAAAVLVSAKEDVGTSERKPPVSSRVPLSRSTPGPASVRREGPLTITPHNTVVESKSVQSHSKTNSKDSSGSSASGFGKISSRLGFLTRRAKKVPGEGADGTTEIRSRKGPVAGTGSEGYGKHAELGRKTSDDRRDGSSSNRAPRPSTSRNGSGTESDLDKFVIQRLEPVIILGGGGSRNRPESDAPTVWPTSGQSLHAGTSTFGPTSRAIVDPVHAADKDPRSQSGTSSSDASTGKDSEGSKSLLSPTLVDAPTLAVRRSFHRSRVYGVSKEPLRIITPPNTGNRSALPLLESPNTTRPSIPSTTISLPPNQNQIRRVNFGQYIKMDKKAKSLKGNWFQGSHETERAAKGSVPRATKVMEMPAEIASVSMLRPIPYYAVMDSENDNDTTSGLEDFLDQVVESSPASSTPDLPLSSVPSSKRQHVQSILLPSPPNSKKDLGAVWTPASTRVFLRRQDPASRPLPEAAGQATGAHKHRLAQVGRIPRVISRKDRQHKPALQSFSRPFGRNDTATTTQPKMVAEVMSPTERPTLGIRTDELPSRPFDDFESGMPASAPARPADADQSFDPMGDHEFLSFQASKFPEVSGSSSSEAFMSVVSPRRLTPVPQRHHGEDEVWGEYDDLLDSVLSPNMAKANQSTASSGNTSFRHVTIASMNMQMGLDQSPTEKMPVSTTARPLMQSPSVCLPPALPSAGSIQEVRLRRSRILSALRSSYAPSSFSVGDLLVEDGVGIGDDGHITPKSSPATVSKMSYLPALAYEAREQTKASRPAEKNHQQSTMLLDVAERDQAGPVAQSDLRFAALMTSRWLSFGRVLFSPAHREIESQTDQHILVIDGLGNDDWSFYCALTYPTAIIHDLKETDFSPAFRREFCSDPLRAPPNYVGVDHSSLAERFPFPQCFFAAVVLRFPPAMADGILRLILSECKRVLMPGGHLEISILDLDMVNMGTHTRKVVRDLKVRMNVADPDVSLKSASDNIQNILGRKGFENLNRCVVGVPVAGKVAGSVESNSSRSSGGSYGKRKSDQSVQGASVSGGRRASADHTRRRNYDTNFSLSDLISDHSPTSDEKITKIVAKVGRWWYTRCYEWAVLPNGDLSQSIWADKMVLQECKARGSGFKLLIAYAQKPVENRRRTLSEPIRPTIAPSATPVLDRADEKSRPQRV